MQVRIIKTGGSKFTVIVKHGATTQLATRIQSDCTKGEILSMVNGEAKLDEESRRSFKQLPLKMSQV